MIDRQGGSVVFECDCCPETFDSETDDFSDAWCKARAEGWKSLKVADQWLHSCGSAKCKLR